MNEFNRLNEQIEYGLALLARLTEAQERIANAADALEAKDKDINGLMTLLAKDRKRIEELEAVVAEQAEDEGLWFVAETAPEAYLQQELRALHSVIEVICRAALENHDE